MKTIHRQLTVPYTTSQMFGLVSDIDRYQDFLPWCKDSRVLQQSVTEVRAMLVLTASGLQKSFTTLNQLTPETNIEISLVDGPFRHLEGRWQFIALNEQSTHIQFDLAFEFSSRLLSLALAPVFQQASTTLIDAFVKRADQLYGH